MMSILHKTPAQECLDEIAAKENQPVEFRSGVHNSKRHPAMGLGGFEQASGRNKRGSGSEGPSSTEGKEPG